MGILHDASDIASIIAKKKMKAEKKKIKKAGFKAATNVVKNAVHQHKFSVKEINKPKF